LQGPTWLRRTLQIKDAKAQRKEYHRAEYRRKNYVTDRLSNV